MSSTAIVATQLDTNDIPYDILFLIFREYARNPSREYDPEALLLVNRSWKEACLSTPVLWCTFYISLGTAADAVQWLSRVKRWIPRIGDSDPVTIHLANEWTESHGSSEHAKFPQICPMSGRRAAKYDRTLICTCLLTIKTHIWSILEELAGKDGQYCTRWLSLYLRTHAVLLQCRTLPNLQRLHIEQLEDNNLSPNMFTSVPKLHDLTLTRIHLPKFFGQGTPLNLAASSITRLSFINCKDGPFNGHPSAFPNVEELEVRGSFAFYRLSGTRFPRLRSLILEVDNPSFDQLSRASHFPIEQLVSLTLLGITVPDQGNPLNFIMTMTSLLQRLKQLETLTLDRPSILPVMDIMRSSEVLLASRPLNIFVIEEAKGYGDTAEMKGPYFIFGAGEERKKEIDRIAEDHGIENMATFFSDQMERFRQLWEAREEPPRNRKRLL